MPNRAPFPTFRNGLGPLTLRMTPKPFHLSLDEMRRVTVVFCQSRETLVWAFRSTESFSRIYAARRLPWPSHKNP